MKARPVSLVARLNLWYGAAILLTLLLAFGVAEFTARQLAMRRSVARLEQVETEVRSVYLSRGADEASAVAIPGVITRLTADQGRALGTSTSRPGADVVEVSTRLDKGVWLHTAMPEEVVLEARRDTRLGLLGGGFLALATALLGGAWVTRRALQPIQDVAATAQQILEKGDTGRRVPSPGTGDQLEEMVALFNQLLDSNASLLRGMRQSLDSVGHDLRTPLTRIRAAAELALSEGGPAALEDALETSLEEAAAAEELLTALLDLTRAEAGMIHLDLAPISLLEVAERVTTLYEHVADERRMRIELDRTQDATVQADRTRLQQAVANLVDNALKFSPEASTVRIGVVREAGRAGLRVADEGPGIPHADLERVFERLYRGDSSRSQEGAGLGLAMVHAIAQAHGGSVDVRSDPPRGAEFTLWLGG